MILNNASRLSGTVEKFAEKPLIQVISRKYDGSRPKQWPARLLRQENSLLILEAAFPTAVNHPQLGYIPRGTISLEYYWLDRWYNVFRFLQPSGALRNFYCNISLPPVLADSILTYTDLDLDLLVAPDGSFEVLDEDEFACHTELFGYPPDLCARARAAVTELSALIRLRQFPFCDLK